MTKFWRGVRRSILTATIAVVAIGICTAAFAQNPPTVPGQVGQQTITITGTAHDFDDGAGPGQDDWLGAGDNMCTPCHGPPQFTPGGGGSSTPTWNHDYDSGTTYDNKNWLYTKYDGTVSGASTFDDLSKKCLGCHDPEIGGADRALQDYTGHVPQIVVLASGSITAFASSPPTSTDVTSAGHGLTTGDLVTITGTTNYNGVDLAVIVVDADTFEIATPFVADDATGTWEKFGPAPDAYVGMDEDLGDDLSISHHPVGIQFTQQMGLDEEYLVDPTTTTYAEGTITTMLLNAAGEINCNSCHEQHNDRRFDLYGNDYHDDPVSPFGWESEKHNFLKIYEGGCRLCHTSGAVAAASGSDDHHFPGRDDPFGDLRGGNPFNCDMCHKVDETASGYQGHTACAGCHTVNGSPTIVRNGLGAATTIGTGHHGGDRDFPYINCAACHADPVTGILTGNTFGNTFAPSCFGCHEDNKWVPAAGNAPPEFTGFDFGSGATGVVGIKINDDSANGGAGLGEVLVGTHNEALAFEALAWDPEGQPLSYTWSFGDGSLAQFPSFDAVTSHTYETYNGQPRSGPKPHILASVAVTDGVNPPIYYEFEILIYEQEGHVEDTWEIDTSDTGIGVDFNVTFENHDGALVAVRNDGGSLAYGVEFVGVIFWMELWMDIGDNAFWGTGDMYFGNVKRGVTGADNGADEGSMSGVVFRSDGSVDTFDATGGAHVGGH